MAEGKQRPLVVEQVTPPCTGLVVVEVGYLSFVANDRHRKFRSRIDIAEQRFGDGDTALLSRVPAFQNRVGFLDDIGPAGRAPVIGGDDQRLAEFGQGIDQFVLLADDVDIGAIAKVIGGETFAAGLFGIPDRKDDRIRSPGDFDRLFDQAQVFLSVGEIDQVLRAVLARRDEHALRGNELGFGRNLSQAFDKADRLLRYTRIATQPGDRVVGPDYGNAAHPRAVEWQRAAFIG